jgi:hypothetical protein
MPFACVIRWGLCVVLTVGSILAASEGFYHQAVRYSGKPVGPQTLLAEIPGFKPNAGESKEEALAQLKALEEDWAQTELRELHSVAMSNRELLLLLKKKICTSMRQLESNLILVDPAADARPL